MTVNYSLDLTFAFDLMGGGTHNALALLRSTPTPSGRDGKRKVIGTIVAQPGETFADLLRTMADVWVQEGSWDGVAALMESAKRGDRVPSGPAVSDENFWDAISINGSSHWLFRSSTDTPKFLAYCGATAERYVEVDGEECVEFDEVDCNDCQREARAMTLIGSQAWAEGKGYA